MLWLVVEAGIQKGTKDRHASFSSLSQLEMAYILTCVCVEEWQCTSIYTLYGVRFWIGLSLLICQVLRLPYLPPSLSLSLLPLLPPSPPSLSPSPLSPSLSPSISLLYVQDFCNSENHDASSAVQQVTETDHLAPLRDTLTLLSVLHEYAQHGESSEHSTEVTGVDSIHTM